MNITELYNDENFNDVLVHLSNLKRIKEFDDFKQDVFLEILNREYKTLKACKAAANRVAYKYGSDYEDADIDDYSYIDDTGNIETSDDTMSRMIYHGRAEKVC